MTIPPLLAKYPDLVMKMRIELIRSRNRSGCQSGCNADAVLDKYMDIARKRQAAFGNKLR